MDDGISLVSKGFEVDVVTLVDQVIHIPSLGFHLGKVGSLACHLFKVKIPVVLVAAVTGLVLFEAVMALDAGEGHIGRHNLVFQPPVHPGFLPT